MDRRAACPSRPAWPALSERFDRRGMGADRAFHPAAALWRPRAAATAPEIVKRNDGQKGFAVLPRRWVIERTLAWLTRCRRLARHYEALAATAVAFIKLAMIRIMLRRLANPSITA